MADLPATSAVGERVACRRTRGQRGRHGFAITIVAALGLLPRDGLPAVSTDAMIADEAHIGQKTRRSSAQR